MSANSETFPSNESNFDDDLPPPPPPPPDISEEENDDSEPITPLDSTEPEEIVIDLDLLSDEEDEEPITPINDVHPNAFGASRNESTAISATTTSSSNNVTALVKNKQPQKTKRGTKDDDSEEEESESESSSTTSSESTSESEDESRARQGGNQQRTSGRSEKGKVPPQKNKNEESIVIDLEDSETESDSDSSSNEDGPSVTNERENERRRTTIPSYNPKTSEALSSAHNVSPSSRLATGPSRDEAHPSRSSQSPSFSLSKQTVQPSHPPSSSPQAPSRQPVPSGVFGHQGKEGPAGTAPTPAQLQQEMHRASEERQQRREQEERNWEREIMKDDGITATIVLPADLTAPLASEQAQPSTSTSASASASASTSASVLSTEPSRQATNSSASDLSAPPYQPASSSSSSSSSSSQSPSTETEAVAQTPEEIQANEALERLKKQRMNVVNETIQTEERYVQQLNNLVYVYKRPMEKRREEFKLQPSDIKVIFSNVEQLLVVNTMLLSELQQCKERNGDGIGDVFLTQGPSLLCYTPYYNNNHRAQTRVSELVSKSRRFAEFDAEAARKPECANLKLASHLVYPVQRLPRYKMLLANLLAYTPEGDPEQPSLEAALHKMEEIIQSINQSMNIASFGEKLKEAVEKMDKIPDISHLLIPGRGCVADSPAKILQKDQLFDVHLYVFTDSICFSFVDLKKKKKKNTIYQTFGHLFPLHFLLNSLMTSRLADSDTESASSSSSAPSQVMTPFRSDAGEELRVYLKVPSNYHTDCPGDAKEVASYFRVPNSDVEKFTTLRLVFYFETAEECSNINQYINTQGNQMKQKREEIVQQMSADRENEDRRVLQELAQRGVNVGELQRRRRGQWNADSSDDFSTQEDLMLYMSKKQAREEQKMKYLTMLLQEEESYCHNLHILDSVFRKTLEKRKKKIVPFLEEMHEEDDLEMMFEGVPHIITAHENLLAEIKDCVEVRDGDNLGEVFMTAVGSMKCYALFVKNGNKRRQKIQHLTEHCPPFAAALDEAEQNPNSEGNTFEELMEAPVPRLPMYVAMLRAICSKIEPGTPQRKMMEQAVQSLKKTIDEINQYVKLTFARKFLIHLLKQVRCTESQRCALLENPRTFVKDTKAELLADLKDTCDALDLDIAQKKALGMKVVVGVGNSASILRSEAAAKLAERSLQHRLSASSRSSGSLRRTQTASGSSLTRTMSAAGVSGEDETRQELNRKVQSVTIPRHFPQLASRSSSMSQLESQTPKYSPTTCVIPEPSSSSSSPSSSSSSSSLVSLPASTSTTVMLSSSPEELAASQPPATMTLPTQYAITNNEKSKKQLRDRKRFQSCKDMEEQEMVSRHKQSVRLILFEDCIMINLMDEKKQMTFKRLVELALLDSISLKVGEIAAIRLCVVMPVNEVLDAESRDRQERDVLRDESLYQTWNENVDSTATMTMCMTTAITSTMTMPIPVAEEEKYCYRIFSFRFASEELAVKFKEAIEEQVRLFRIKNRRNVEIAMGIASS